MRSLLLVGIGSLTLLSLCSSTHATHFTWTVRKDSELSLFPKARREADRRGADFARGLPTQQSQHSREGENRSVKDSRFHYNEAVVVLGTHVDTCLAARLEAIVASSNRDVWFLHDHYFPISLGNNSAKFQEQDWNYQQLTEDMGRSERLLISIVGLKFASQTGEFRGKSKKGIDGARSGRSKSAFLEFVKRYQHAYRYIWHIESDVFFTGPWHKLFDALPENDLIATFWDASSRKSCSADGLCSGSDVFLESCKINGEKCSQGKAAVQTGWPVVRFSVPFALALFEATNDEARRTWGHHETIVVPFCDVYNEAGCTRSDLPSHRVGKVVTAGLPPWNISANHTLMSHAPITGLKAYHPVKCAADKSVGVVAKAWVSYHEKLSQKRQEPVIMHHPLFNYFRAALMVTRLEREEPKSFYNYNDPQVWTVSVARDEQELKASTFLGITSTSPTVFEWSTLHKSWPLAAYSKLKRLITVDASARGIAVYSTTCTSGRCSLATTGYERNLIHKRCDSKPICDGTSSVPCDVSGQQVLCAHDIERIDTWPDYIGRLWLEVEPFDIYVVEGSYRIACAAAALLHGHNDSIVLLNHNGLDVGLLTSVTDVVEENESMMALRRKKEDHKIQYSSMLKALWFNNRHIQS